MEREFRRGKALHLVVVLSLVAVTYFAELLCGAGEKSKTSG